MKKFTVAFSILALAACNKPGQKAADEKTAQAKAEAAAQAAVGEKELETPWAPPAGEQVAKQIFNLAQYVKDNASLSALHSLVAEGNAYLFFGDAKFFRAETNMIIDANAEEGGEKEKGIYAQYFLDAIALGKKLPTDGHTVDLGASATLATPSTVEAHVRFLGDDKWKATVKGAFDQSFMRDIPFSLPFSPIPAVGLVLGGAIGGEIGLKGELGARIDNAAQLVFIPRVNLQAKVNGGIKLIEILKAQAEGIIKLIQVTLHASANMGAIPDSNYMYGNIGAEAGELTAIDGKIDLVAGAGYDGILPGGLDKILLQKLIEKLNFGTLNDLTWRYTLYDPKPVVVKDIPGFGKSFMNFYKQPKDRADCQTKTAGINSQISAHKKSVEEILIKEEGLDKKIAESNVKTFDEILTRIKGYCK